MRLAALAMAVLVAFGACGTTAPEEGVAGRSIAKLPRPVVSGAILDLVVSEEDVADTVARFQRSYADAISVYSFRRADGLLQATLQVSRFADAGKLQEAGIRRRLVEQLGSTTPVALDVGTSTVYVSRGNKQRLFTWFRGGHVFVLAVRDDYREVRTLLREAVGLRA